MKNDPSARDASADEPQHATSPPLGPLPQAGGELLAEAERRFDPQLAITLLREHARRLPSSTDKRKNQRTTARMATNEEVREALVQRLKAFAMRRGKPELTVRLDGADPVNRSVRFSMVG